MNPEWPSFKVLDLQVSGVLLVEDGNHGEYRPRTHEFVEQGVAFIRAADMNGGQVQFESASRINSTAFARIRKGIGAPGDIILSHKGTVGKVAIVPLKCPTFVCSPQTTFWRVLDEASLDRRFLWSFLRSPAFSQQLQRYAGETDMAPYVSLTNQRQLEIQLPPLAEQKAISHILGTLDDKIELNRQMNRTLEDIARALFKSWFVDFDPVHAKARGEPPAGMDAATAALFPAEFEESELGLIPKGWRVEALGEHISAAKGLSYQGKYLADSGVPLHNLNSVYEGGGYKHEGIKYYSGEYKARHRVRPGDLIVTNTEQGFDRLLIGYPALIPRTFGHWGLFTHHLYRVETLKGSALTNEYLYFLLRTDWYHTWVSGFGNGTTVNMLPADALEKPGVLIPPEPLIHKFNGIVQPMLELTENNIDESETLAELRDTLLPKLMSGELRVPEAEGDD